MYMKYLICKFWSFFLSAFQMVVRRFPSGMRLDFMRCTWKNVVFNVRLRRKTKSLLKK